jgi:hypothetical protein
MIKLQQAIHVMDTCPIICAGYDIAQPTNTELQGCYQVCTAVQFNVNVEMVYIKHSLGHMGEEYSVLLNAASILSNQGAQLLLEMHVTLCYKALRILSTTSSSHQLSPP